MSRRSGVTRETVKRLILDAGVVYLGWGTTNQRILGASRGGSQITIESEFRDMEYDGTASLIEGSRRIIKTSASLTVNLVEINKDIIKIAIPGSEYGNAIPATDLTTHPNSTPITGENYYEIKRALEKTIPDFSYENVAICAEYSGTQSPIIFVLEKAMANSNFELSFADADESVLSITFTGFSDADNPEVEPWKILVPSKIPTV